MMTTRVTIAATLLILFMGLTSANAVPVVRDALCENTNNLCALGIDGLEVLGTTLDVEFVLGSYNDIYTNDDPYFLGDEVGANAAAEAIVALLDGLYWGPIGDGEDERPDGRDDLIFINTELTPDNTFGAVLTNVEGGTDWDFRSAPAQQLSPPDFDTSRFAPGNYVVWAVFSETVGVPEPGTLALFVAGVGVAGVARRRRRV